MEKLRCARMIGRPDADSRSQKPRTMTSRSSPSSADRVSQSATLSSKISDTSGWPNFRVRGRFGPSIVQAREMLRNVEKLSPRPRRTRVAKQPRRQTMTCRPERDIGMPPLDSSQPPSPSCSMLPLRSRRPRHRRNGYGRAASASRRCMSSAPNSGCAGHRCKCRPAPPRAAVSSISAGHTASTSIVIFSPSSNLRKSEFCATSLL